MNAKRLIKIILTLSFSTVLLIGCGNDSLNIPFSDLNFESSYEEMVKELGEPQDETSSYLGTSYCYESDYLVEGSEARYTFDDDENLASISWIYESEDGEEITAYYNDLHKQLVNKYGETTEATNDVTQLSDIWRLETGNITLIALVSSEYNAVMYTYISPENSTSATK